MGYALLSAAHGVYASILAGQGLAAGDLSATDPRGFATFGLAGIWMIAVPSFIFEVKAAMYASGVTVSEP